MYQVNLYLAALSFLRALLSVLRYCGVNLLLFCPDRVASRDHACTHAGLDRRRGSTVLSRPSCASVFFLQEGFV